jgi:hypothetical protein
MAVRGLQMEMKFVGYYAVVPGISIQGLAVLLIASVCCLTPATPISVFELYVVPHSLWLPAGWTLLYQN